MDFNFLFYDGFETLDIFGPIEVFSAIEDANLNYFSIDGGLIKSEQGYEINTKSADEINKNGILVIPGAEDTNIHVTYDDFIDELRSLCESAEYVLSICTGSALLAKAGVLDNRSATSNKLAFEWVKTVSSKVNWIRNARWVVDGKYYTASGVAAGMDMAFGFANDLFGDEMTDKISEEIEYVWNPNKDCDVF